MPILGAVVTGNKALTVVFVLFVYCIGMTKTYTTQHNTLSHFKPPGMPILGAVIAGNKALTVVFGISAVTTISGGGVVQYEVVTSPGGFVASAFASPIVVRGLQNGVTYTVTLAAVNAFGHSARVNSASIDNNSGNGNNSGLGDGSGSGDDDGNGNDAKIGVVATPAGALPATPRMGYASGGNARAFVTFARGGASVTNISSGSGSSSSSSSSSSSISSSSSSSSSSSGGGDADGGLVTQWRRGESYTVAATTAASSLLSSSASFASLVAGNDRSPLTFLHADSANDDMFTYTVRAHNR
jgi:hypothetical protein